MNARVRFVSMGVKVILLMHSIVLLPYVTLYSAVGKSTTFIFRFFDGLGTTPISEPGPGLVGVRPVCRF